VVKRVAKEMSKLIEKPLEDITVHINDGDLTDIQATLVGPGMFGLARRNACAGRPPGGWILPTLTVDLFLSFFLPRPPSSSLPVSSSGDTF
jgi:hypothetical protein